MKISNLEKHEQKTIPSKETVDLGKLSIDFIDYDFAFPDKNTHKEKQIAEAIADPEVDIVIPEYFEPAINHELDKIQIISGLIKKMNLWENTDDLGQRILTSRRISSLIAEHEKKVAVLDFGNNPYWYSINLGLQYAVQILPSIIAGSIIGERQGLYELQKLMALGIGGIIGVTPSIIDFTMNFKGKGHYSKSDIAEYERILLHIEDARRVLIAKKIHDMNERATERQKILYILPNAHRIRVAEMLKEWDSNPVLRAKSRIYQSLLVGISSEAEFWEYSEEQWKKR